MAYVWVRLSKEQTQMSDLTVNVPLLRKAVEWAEAEAAKPWELSEWNQAAVSARPSQFRYRYDERGIEIPATKAPECGTCYCVAGFIAANNLAPNEVMFGGASIFADGKYVEGAIDRAASLLGIDPDAALEDDGLFAGGNTIEDVRHIAEKIAGERL